MEIYYRAALVDAAALTSHSGIFCAFTFLIENAAVMYVGPQIVKVYVNMHVVPQMIKVYVNMHVGSTFCMWGSNTDTVCCNVA
jgi:hypothetical protein